MTLLTRLLAVPHGYWLALTVGVVLRQDYLSTLTRGLARFGGTLVGVLLASLLVWALHPGLAALGLLSLGAAWLVYALFPTSYAAFSAAITLYVVFSVSASGLPERLVVEQRIWLTLLGGLMALGVYRAVARVALGAASGGLAAGRRGAAALRAGGGGPAPRRRPRAGQHRAPRRPRRCGFRPSNWRRPHGWSRPGGCRKRSDRLPRPTPP